MLDFTRDNNIILMTHALNCEMHKEVCEKIKVNRVLQMGRRSRICIHTFPEPYLGADPGGGGGGAGGPGPPLGSPE